MRNICFFKSYLQDNELISYHFRKIQSYSHTRKQYIGIKDNHNKGIFRIIVVILGTSTVIYKGLGVEGLPRVDQVKGFPKIYEYMVYQATLFRPPGPHTGAQEGKGG